MKFSILDESNVHRVVNDLLSSCASNRRLEMSNKYFSCVHSKVETIPASRALSGKLSRGHLVKRLRNLSVELDSLNQPLKGFVSSQLPPAKEKLFQ